MPRLGLGLGLQRRRDVAVSTSILDLLSVPSAAAYSLRQLRRGFNGAAVRVRHSVTNAETDIGFTPAGDLDTDALTLFCGAPARPLDAVTGAAAAYSLRRLRTGYTGPAIRVRNGATNLETDIGFTAAGNLDQAALLAFTGSENLILWSEQFDNAAWTTKDQITVTAAPGLGPGGSMAYRITENTAVSVRKRISQSSTSASTATHTVVFRVKPMGRNWVFIRASGVGAGGYFNLTGAGAIGTVSGGYAGAIQAVEDGWYLVALTDLTGTTTKSAYLGLAVSDGGEFYTGDGVSGVLLSRSQLCAGPASLGYNATTTTAISTVPSGFVTTWYDQSGNSRNAVQGTAANQPRIVNAGVVDVLGTAPALRFSNANFTLTNTTAQPVTVSIVHRFNTSTSGAHLTDGLSGSRILIGSNGPTYQQFAGAVVAGPAITLGTTRVLTGVFNSASSSLALDGTTAATNAGTLGMATQVIGAGAGAGSVGTRMDGWMHEYIVYNSALSAGNITALEQSQAVYFGVTYATTIPSGFVTTWYDQSGNGANASQGTAAAQPRIVNAGVIDTASGRPTIEFTGTAWLGLASRPLTGATNLSVSSVFNMRTASPSFEMLFVQSDGTANAGNFEIRRRLTNDQLEVVYGPTQIGFNQLLTGSINDVTQILTAVRRAGTDVASWRAGTLVNSATSADVTPIASRDARIGGRSDGNNLTGGVSELIPFAAALATTDRQTLERNQGSYFSISVA
jgi:hypothetical protein